MNLKEDCSFQFFKCEHQLLIFPHHRITQLTLGLSTETCTRLSMSSSLKVYAQSYQPMSKIFHNHLTFTFTPEMNYYIHLFCLHCSDKLLVKDRSIDFFYEFLFHMRLYAIGCKQDTCTNLLSSLILLCHITV